MPKRLREEDLASVIDIVQQSTNGARRSDIAKVLENVPQRTLQYWLKNLVDDGRLLQDGKGPAARYLISTVAQEHRGAPAPQAAGDEKPEEVVLPLSAESERIHKYLQQPSVTRKAVGYDRKFLDSYRPIDTALMYCYAAA